MFALLLICVLLLMIIYSRQASTKENYSSSNEQSGTFGGFMEYNNMYYMVLYADSTDKKLPLATRGPLPGHYIKIPCLDPNGVYEVAQRRDVYMPQAINPNTYTEMVGQGFRALPILRAGGDSLTGDDIANIRKQIANADNSTHTWSYIGRDMRSVPASLFEPDQSYNQYFQDKIYRLFNTLS